MRADGTVFMQYTHCKTTQKTLFIKSHTDYRDSLRLQGTSSKSGIDFGYQDKSLRDFKHSKARKD